MLVVDASIAGRAGNGDHRDTQACVAVLGAIQRSPHRVAFSPVLWEEWNRHRRRAAIQFLASLVARRRINKRDPPQNAALRRCLANSTQIPAHRVLMEEDAHLLELALDTDRIVLSVDRMMHGLFGAAAARCREIRSTHWLNPEDDAGQCCDWLSGGCRVDARLTLAADAGD